MAIKDKLDTWLKTECLDIGVDALNAGGTDELIKILERFTECQCGVYDEQKDINKIVFTDRTDIETGRLLRKNPDPSHVDLSLGYVEMKSGKTYKIYPDTNIYTERPNEEEKQAINAWFRKYGTMLNREMLIIRRMALLFPEYQKYFGKYVQRTPESLSQGVQQTYIKPILGGGERFIVEEPTVGIKLVESEGGKVIGLRKAQKTEGEKKEEIERGKAMSEWAERILKAERGQ